MIEPTNGSGSAAAKQVLDYATPPSQGIRVSWLAILGLAAILVLMGLMLLPRWEIVINKLSCAMRNQRASDHHRGLYDYSQKNGGSMPATLAALTTITPNLAKVLHCPTGPGAYVYVAQNINLPTAPHGTILLYEPPTNHKDPKTGKGAMNVAYADGSVRQVVQPQADKIIAELRAGHNPPRPEMIQ